MTGPGGASLPGLPYRELALVALTASVIAFLATGVVREIIGKWISPPPPRERDMHSTPIPRVGGIAIWISILAGLCMAASMPALKNSFIYSEALTFTLLATTLIVVTGAIDDAVGLSASVKLVAQILSGLILVAGGVTWDAVYLPGRVYILDPNLSATLTVAVTVACINAANLIDGLDGLLAGIALISGAGLGILALVHIKNSHGLVSFYPAAILSALTVGACIGFLPHNFHPAKIFLGDAGSMQLGVLLASVTIQLSGQSGPAVYAGAQDAIVILAPFAVVFAVMLVPMADMVLAIARRARSRSGIFVADRLHIHHRIVSAGISHRNAVLCIYAFCTVLTALSLAVMIIPDATMAIAAICVVLLTVFALGVLVWRKSRSA